MPNLYKQWALDRVVHRNMQRSEIAFELKKVQTLGCPMTRRHISLLPPILLTKVSLFYICWMRVAMRL